MGKYMQPLPFYVWFEYTPFERVYVLTQAYMRTRHTLLLTTHFTVPYQMVGSTCAEKILTACK